MILIQLLLIAALLYIMIRFLASRKSNRTEAWKKIALLLLIVAAVTVVLFPGSTNRLAHLVGVGRGADLLLYGLVIAFIFAQLNNHLKTKEERYKIVALTRKVAILEANLKNRKHK